MSHKEEEEPKRVRAIIFPNHLFVNRDQEEVDEIPPEINGKKLYQDQNNKGQILL